MKWPMGLTFIMKLEIGFQHNSFEVREVFYNILKFIFKHIVSNAYFILYKFFCKYFFCKQACIVFE
jgi:hypothetical protein